MNKRYFVIGLLSLVLGVTTLLGYGFPIRPFESVGGWQVTYHTMLDGGLWGDVIGTETFSTEFAYDPLIPAVERSEPIGFKSSLEINIHEDTVVQFTVGADDGVISLSIDDEVLIHLEAPDPDREESSDTLLKVGKHDLEIQYYQLYPVLEDDAYASFGIRKPDANQSRAIKSGLIALIFVGSLLVFLSKKREPILDKAVHEKDVMSIVYTFVYLFLSSYILVSIFQLS